MGGDMMTRNQDADRRLRGMKQGFGWRSRLLTATVGVMTSVMVGWPGLTARANPTLSPEIDSKISADPFTVEAFPVVEPGVAPTTAPVTAILPAACTVQLSRNINAIISRSAYRSGKWGVHIESLETGEVLYSHNASQYFIPASNIKLFTTAAALQLYDPRSPIDSSTLGGRVQVINQRSHNGYADNLLRRIGGATAVRQALSTLGIMDGYRQADGSGLSRSNQVTPRATVDMLKVMDYAYGRAVFYHSLPVAGVSGTLTRRFRSTPAQGIVHAKTGTLKGVRALSGYLEHPRYGRIVFSVLVNQPGQSGQTLLNGLDQIVVQLAGLDDCYPV